MEKKPVKKTIWPYIVAAVAVIVAILLAALLIFPKITGGDLQNSYSHSEYQKNETALKSPSSYDELYKTIEKHIPDDDYSLYTTGAVDTVVEEIAAEESISESETSAAAITADAAKGDGSSSDHSDTNIRTEGVLEGDIVKTDGRYIYACFPDTGEFTITDTQDKMEVVYSGLILKDEGYICREFYVSGDKLYFAGQKERYSYNADDSSSRWTTQAFLLTYDISDRTQPELEATYVQDGDYDSVRIVGDMCYIFTNYYQYKLDKDSYIPCFNGVQAACEDIYYGKFFSSVNYYCVGAVDLNDPSVCKSAKAVLAGSGQIYVSDQSIFVLSSDWIEERAQSYYATDIVALEYDDNDITGVAVSSVPGFLNDSFSVDHYNGFLRLVTTVRSYTNHEMTFMDEWFGGNIYYPTTSTENNSLWILDKNLNLISSLENIQENETIRSARFMGDVVYFVTFRQTDPLFAVDLSDPYSPKMLDGIKLSGFSNYLHFWKDGLLLGLGYEATETGMITGAKISMFDISDPKNIKEVDRCVLDTESATISSEYSYKAVLADPEKNLIGFATERFIDDWENSYYANKGTYYLYSYDPDDGGFKQELEAPLFFEKNEYYYYPEPIIDDGIVYEEEIIDEDVSQGSISDLEESNGSIFDGLIEEEKDTEEDPLSDIESEYKYMYITIKDIRGLYIGDQFYIVHPGMKIYQYDLASKKKVDTVTLFSDQNRW